MAAAAQSLGSIYAEISLRISDFARKADLVRREIADLDRRLDNLSRSSQAAGSGLAAGLTGFLGRLTAGVGMVSGMLTTIGATTGAAMGLQFDMMTEQAQISFETLLGSAEAARRRMQEILGFARATPFEVEGLLDLDRRLQGLGIAAEDSLPTLRILGDAVAAVGGNSETLERVVTAIGQIATKGRVQMEELLQLAEANLPVFRILQEELGLTQEELANIGREGIPAERALEAILRGLDRLYGGQMERQSRSLAGQVSNLKDNLRQLLGVAMRPVANFLKDTLLPRLNQAAETFLRVHQRAGLLAALRSVLPERAVRQFYEAIQLVRMGWEALTGSVASRQSIFETLGSIVLRAAQTFYVLAKAMRWLLDNWGAVRNAILNVALAFASWRIISTVIIWLVNLYRTIRQLAAGVGILQAILIALRNPLIAIGAAAAVAIAHASGLLDKIRSWIGAQIDKLFPDIKVPDLPAAPDIGASSKPVVPRGVPDLDLPGGGGSGGSKSKSAAATDPVNELLDRIRRRVDIARARADVALQELRLKGIAEDSAEYRRKERDLLMQVRARLLEGVTQMRNLMRRLRGEARERAELEMLRLQAEANEILLQIRENTKALRPDFGLPFGIQPLRLFEYRARREGTRGITIATPQIVVHLPNIRGGINAGKQFVDALEAALAGRLAAEIRAGI